ncbi:MAG: outer membrane lipoprotein-sorting protein [Bacteroidales bacterium]|nr:outer membrane lipoprotein-sorting protein [Bacteroidales bacterium]
MKNMITLNTRKTLITLLSLIILLPYLSISLLGQTPTAQQILERIDRNQSADSRIFTASMIIHAQRGERTMEMKIWSVGNQKSFTEYLAPAREKGTKMLKLADQLWMYSPSADRTIQISGHMLRQSVMGSDLSYEDMMDDQRLTDNYDAQVVGPDTLGGRDCWVLELRARSTDLAYQRRKMWIDRERYVPLKEELYAKSGKLLKQTLLSDVKLIDGRWFPTRVVYQDMLKLGGGTEFVIHEIRFNVPIAESTFNKSMLK